MHKLTVFMTSVLLAAPAASVRADVIGLKTNKSAGEELTLSLNGGVTAQLVWSNGDTESVEFDGYPTKVGVAADSVTITTDETVTLLYAPSDGLVSLNTAGATGLKKLVCPDNALTTLDLTQNTALVVLDCQKNSLTSLAISSCRNLEEINCAQNELGSLPYSAATKITHLICAENNIDTLRYQTSLRNLNTIWCQNNALRTLNLKNSSKLKQICASSNDLYLLTLGSMPNLTDLWVENNALTGIDLSAGAPSLVAVSVNDNELSEIVWDADCSSKLTYFYGQNNSLFFNSFPASSSRLTGVFAPQGEFYLFDQIGVNETVDLSSYMATNGFGTTSRKSYVVTNGAGETLVRGTDYLNSSNKWTFYSAQDDVTLAVTATAYDMTINVKPFDVVDATGIRGVSAGSNGLKISGENGSLKVSAAAAARVRAYNAAGIRVLDETVGSGEHSWSLPAGVYVVNGTKVIIP